MFSRSIFRKTAPGFLGLAVLSAFTACASAGGGAGPSREATYLSSLPAPRASCRSAPSPARLPALPELADSAALFHAIAELSARRGLATPRDTMYALYSIAFAQDGRAERVRGIQWWMPEGTAEELAGVVRRHLKPQAGSGSIRLRVRPGSSPEVTVGRSEVCRPATGASFHLMAPQLNPLAKPLPILLRVRVTEGGRVMGTELLRSSGDEEVDRWVRGVLGRYAYSPGLVDGIPVEMEYEQTVQIKARR